jgi:hypothetical protein
LPPGASRSSMPTHSPWSAWTTSSPNGGARPSSASARSSSSSTRRTPAPKRPGAAAALPAAQRLAAGQPDRHLVLLTATPHSGDEEAFYNLLGLLRPTSPNLKDLPPACAPTCARTSSATSSSAAGLTSRSGKTASMFPDRKSMPRSPTAHRRLGPASSTTCWPTPASWSNAEGQGLREQRMNWWAALALLRCISSSPAAAVNALRTRLQGAKGEADAAGEHAWRSSRPGRREGARRHGRRPVHDDIEPGAQTEDSLRLRS